MNTKIPFGDRIDATVVRQNGILLSARFGTLWTFEHYRKGRLIDGWTQGNVCTVEGLNHLLDATFHGGTQISTWYLLLYDSDTTPSESTTYATPVFTEVTSKIDESTRPEFVGAAASSKSITNSANKATFTFNSSDTIYGGALVGGGTSASTKGDTAGGGVMFCAVKFGSSKSVVNTDVILVTCTITLANA